MNVKTLKAALCFLLCAQTALCQDFMTNEIIAAKTRKALDNDQKTISDILSDTSFMYMHSSTAFREIIKEHAKAEKIKIITAKTTVATSPKTGVKTSNKIDPIF